MPARLVALDEGADIVLDRAMVVVGRHPQCDARLDSLRISRHHCCMTQDRDDVVIRDLGSTNGIRINGQRVEMGRLRPGDELSIAHIRYRLDNGGGPAQEKTLADPRLKEHDPISPEILAPIGPSLKLDSGPMKDDPGSDPQGENPLAAAVRELLPAGVADRCRIQVIVHMPHDAGGAANAAGAAAALEKFDACRPDSSP
jgi:FHA domain